MSRHALLVMVAVEVLLACSAGGGNSVAAGGDIAADPPAVVVTRRFTFAEAGGAQQPIDDVASLQAFRVDVGGRYAAPVKAEASGDGVFTLRGIPQGARYLLALQTTDGGRLYVDGSARTVNLGRRVNGRSDRTEVASPTPVTFDLDGLVPWDPDAEVQLYATGAEALITPNSMLPVAPGATSISGTEDWSALTQPAQPAIDTSRGDRVFLTQLSSVPCPPGLSCRAALRAAEVPTLTLADGVGATIAATLAPVPQSKALQVSWRTSEFEAFAADMHPALDLSIMPAHVAMLDAAAGPFGPDAPMPRGGAPDLLVATAPANTPDVEVNVPYSHPLPDELPEFVLSGFFGSVWVLPDGATNTRHVTVAIRTSAPAPVQELAPGISPPRDLRLDGAPAAGGLAGVGDQPVLSWAAPSLGTPTHYEVSLRAFRVTNGFAAPGQRVASLFTRQTSWRLPPGLLEPGVTYVALVRAWDQPGADPEGAPLRWSWTYVDAEAATGGFTR